LIAAGACAALNILKTGKPQKHADGIAKKLRDGMQKIMDEHQVAGAVYGESSTFHLYFGKLDQRGINGLTAAQFKGVPKDTVKAFRKGLRLRGADLMSYLGGVTSLAHTDEDVNRMLDIFKGTVQDMIKEGLVGRA
jgi:glutamate-1-semialdehyde 2,1-aminomutase